MRPTPLFAALAILSALAARAEAAVTYQDTLVHETTTTTEIDLDASTVLCSSADYGALFLKVLIPELAAITLLDHENLGAGAPCVASGLCAPGNLPEDIVDDDEPTEVVDIEVRAIRRDWVDSDAGTCNPWLVETVEVDIRGVTFTHERQDDLGARPIEDCKTAADPEPDPEPDPDPEPGDDAEPGDEGAGDDGKSDAYGDPIEGEPAAKPEDGSAGGCSAGAGTSTSGFVALALFGFGLALRRRAVR